MAARFEKDTSQQWTQPLMHYVTFEWVVDVLKRVTNMDDKEAIMKAVAATKMADSMAGPIDFTAPVAPNSLHIVPNVVSTPSFYATVGEGDQAVPIRHQAVDVRHASHRKHHGSSDPATGSRCSRCSTA